MDNNEIDDELEDELFTDETEPLTFGGWLLDILGAWGPAVFAVFFIRSAIAEPFQIPSGSMVPTLAIGDHILVTKFSYGFRIPLTPDSHRLTEHSRTGRCHRICISRVRREFRWVLQTISLHRPTLPPFFNARLCKTCGWTARGSSVRQGQCTLHQRQKTREGLCR